MKHLFLDCDDIEMSVYQWGSRDKPTILCVHGLGSSGLSFLEIAEYIKRDYCVMSLELPGHGELAISSNIDFEISCLCVWIRKILIKIELHEFFVLSHSWGAEIMTHYASIFPIGIKGIILLDGGYHNKKLGYENNKVNHSGFTSLQEEQNFYLKDFDEYVFDNWSDYINSESKQYMRWSPLLEEAAKDLMIEKDNKVSFKVKGSIASLALEGMYNSSYPKCLKNTTIPIILILSMLLKS